MSNQIVLKHHEFVVIQVLVTNSCKWLQFDKCEHSFLYTPKAYNVNGFLDLYGGRVYLNFMPFYSIRTVKSFI